MNFLAKLRVNFSNTPMNKFPQNSQTSQRDEMESLEHEVDKLNRALAISNAKVQLYELILQSHNVWPEALTITPVVDDLAWGRLHRS